MNRRNFLSKLTVGVTVAVVAPKLLIPKQRTQLGPKEILAIREQMMSSIANMPLWGGWYTEQEALARLRMQQDFERAVFFGNFKNKGNGLLRNTK